MRLRDRLARKALSAGDPVDFSLPDDEGRTFTFDASFRQARHSILLWYRGHW